MVWQGVKKTGYNPHVRERGVGNRGQSCSADPTIVRGKSCGLGALPYKRDKLRSCFLATDWFFPTISGPRYELSPRIIPTAYSRPVAHHRGTS